MTEVVSVTPIGEILPEPTIMVLTIQVKKMENAYRAARNVTAMSFIRRYSKLMKVFSHGCVRIVTLLNVSCC